MEQQTAQKPSAYAPPVSTMCRSVRSFSSLANIGEDSRLHASREKRIALYTSTPTLAELSDILARRKFVRRIAASLLSIERLVSVDAYAHLAALVRPSVLAGIAPDADDDVLTAIALGAKADFHADDR